VGGVKFASLRRAGVFSELAILFPSEAEVRELLADLGASRQGMARLPALGNMAPVLYWRRVCELIDNGMFAEFGLDELVAAARQRFPSNTALRGLGGGELTLGSELSVLCLQASPAALSQLQLRREQAILLQIASRRGERTLNVKANPATQRDDIVAEILAARPDIVHFCGHGTRDGRLVFEQADGGPAPITVDALASVLRVLPASLPCLVLGSCFGASYAGRLLGGALAVAGSVTALPDQAAVEFTRGFYTALAIGGTSLAKAYDAGLAQMQIHGHDTADMRFEQLPDGSE
jgi:Effector-associated domain 1/CHAT domain